MSSIAIVGSTNYPHLPDVEALVRRIAADDPSHVIVSGGAKGVDKTAETTAFACGLSVVSFRVIELGMESFAAQEWHIGHKPYVRVMTEQPTWRNYVSALQFRNSLIIERADRVVAFWDGYSGGTTTSMDFAHAYKRPLKVYGVRDGERCILS